MSAAKSAIPRRKDNTERLQLPLKICTLIKIRNYVRRRYQRTRHLILHAGFKILNQIIANRLAHLRNVKWSTFLQTLQPHTAPLWKIVRYFTKRREPISPLIYQGKQYYKAEDKADLLARLFAYNHGLTTPSVSTYHGRDVERIVETFFNHKGRSTTDPPLISHT